jgi:hypothetical protein
LALLIVAYRRSWSGIFLRKIPDSQKETRNIHRRGRLVETAATMEKSKTLRCFFPQLAWKSRAKNVLGFIHSSNKPGGGQLIKLGNDQKGRNLRKTRLVFDSSHPLTQ